jgi:hypothetical protein
MQIEMKRTRNERRLSVRKTKDHRTAVFGGRYMGINDEKERSVGGEGPFIRAARGRKAKSSDP